MKLKYDLSFINIDGNSVAVPIDIDEKCRCVLHMNGITADILKTPDADVTESGRLFLPLWHIYCNATFSP